MGQWSLSCLHFSLVDEKITCGKMKEKKTKRKDKEYKMGRSFLIE